MDFFSGVRVDAIVNFSMLAGRLLSCSSFIVRGVTRIPPSASSTHLCVQTTTRLLNASARMRVSERQPWSSRDFVVRLHEFSLFRLISFVLISAASRRKTSHNDDRRAEGAKANED